jgi:hypothetical protein
VIVAELLDDVALDFPAEGRDDAPSFKDLLLGLCGPVLLLAVVADPGFKVRDEFLNDHNVDFIII